MKSCDLQHIISEAVEESADIGMIYDKEDPKRKSELAETKKTVFERLKELI